MLYKDSFQISSTSQKSQEDSELENMFALPGGQHQTARRFIRKTQKMGFRA